MRLAVAAAGARCDRPRPPADRGDGEPRRNGAERRRRARPLSLALVLGGGGPLAVAWETGLVAGLAGAGAAVEPAADLVLGTSAGAILGGQLRHGADPAALAARILDEARGVPPPGAMPAADPRALARLPELFRLAHSAGDAAAARASVGAEALAAAPAEPETAYVARLAQALPSAGWPERRLACVAVDAADGSVVGLERGCGAGLDAAVAASCSLPGLSPPVTIAGRHYMDGGLASAANADLAAGFARVVVIAFRPPGAQGERMAARLAPQLAALRGGGAEVLLIAPDQAALDAIGPLTMDVRRRPAVARAGIAQGVSAASAVSEFVRAAPRAPAVTSP